MMVRLGVHRRLRHDDPRLRVGPRLRVVGRFLASCTRHQPRFRFLRVPMIALHLRHLPQRLPDRLTQLLRFLQTLRQPVLTHFRFLRPFHPPGHLGNRRFPPPPQPLPSLPILHPPPPRPPPTVRRDATARIFVPSTAWQIRPTNPCAAATFTPARNTPPQRLPVLPPEPPQGVVIRRVPSR